MQHVVGEIADAAHPAWVAAQAQRGWLHERFTEWAHDAGVHDAPQVAGALLVIFDGAVAASEQDGPVRAKDATRLVGAPMDSVMRRAWRDSRFIDASGDNLTHRAHILGIDGCFGER